MKFREDESCVVRFNGKKFYSWRAVCERSWGVSHLVSHSNQIDSSARGWENNFTSNISTDAK